MSEKNPEMRGFRACSSIFLQIPSHVHVNYNAAAKKKNLVEEAYFILSLFIASDNLRANISNLLLQGGIKG